MVCVSGGGGESEDKNDPLASHEGTKARSPTMSGPVSCLPSLWLGNLKLVSLPL